MYQANHKSSGTVYKRGDLGRVKSGIPGNENFVPYDFAIEKTWFEGLDPAMQDNLRAKGWLTKGNPEGFEQTADGDADDESGGDEDDDN